MTFTVKIRRFCLIACSVVTALPAVCFAAAPAKQAEPALAAPVVDAEDLPAVNKVKKSLRHFASECFAQQYDRTSSRVPAFCKADRQQLAAALAKLSPRQRTHAVMLHGVVPIVFSQSDNDYDNVGLWHGATDQNASAFREFLRDADAALLAPYVVVTMQKVAAKRHTLRAKGDRLEYLGNLIEFQGIAPPEALPPPWQNGKGTEMSAVANLWLTWLRQRENLTSEQLVAQGKQELLARLADPNLAVRFHALRVGAILTDDAIFTPTLWAIRDVFLHQKLTKQQIQAFDVALYGVDTLALISPRPIAGRTLQPLDNPLGPVQPIADDVTATVPVFAKPEVPKKLKAAVAALEILLKPVMAQCWTEPNDDGGETEWSTECNDALDLARASHGDEADPTVLQHAVGRALLLPMLQGKLHTPDKKRTVTPLDLYYYYLAQGHFALTNAYVLHGFSLALAQPVWKTDRLNLVREIMILTLQSMNIFVSRSPPFAPDGQDQAAQRGIMTQFLQAYPREFGSNTPNSQIVQWAGRFNDKAMLSRNLAIRYRAVCDNSRADEVSESPLRLQGQRQVLLDTSLPLEVRKAFGDWPSCDRMKVSHLLAPEPVPALPNAGIAQMLPQTAQPTPADQPPVAAGDCQTEMSAWHTETALDACAQEAKDSPEPIHIIRHLWTKLDAGQDALPVAKQVETLLPSWAGADRSAGQVLLAAALTVAGDTARARTLLATWLAKEANADQADRLALLNGGKPKQHWWFSVLVGVQCTPKLNAQARQTWLLRRGWIGGLADFEKSKARLGPDVLRRAAAHARDVNHCGAS